MQIDEIIDRIHQLSRAEAGYVLTDEDKRLLAILANQLSAAQMSLLETEEPN